LPLRLEAAVIAHGWRIPAGLSLVTVLRKGAAASAQSPLAGRGLLRRLERRDAVPRTPR
jgi:hypothetical protein